MQFSTRSASSIWLVGALNESFQSSELRKLHSECQYIKKNIHPSLATNLFNQEKFFKSLNDLFDIAHQDVMSTIKIKEN